MSVPELAVVVLRLLQYAGATILMGSALFFLYALPAAGPAAAAQRRWPRRLLLVSAAVLALSAGLGLIAQTSVMAGSLSAGLSPEALGFVISGTGLGRASLVRLGAAVAALTALLVLRAGRNVWLSTSAAGAAACASLAWMGHGAATEGPNGALHLASDILHAWAAAGWVGALVAFSFLLAARDPEFPFAEALQRALQRFSGIGSLLVATLVATGLVNSWILVGPEKIESLWTTPYGRLLSLKIALVGAMLALAAANRLRLTPAFAAALGSPADREGGRRQLRRSLAAETGLAFAVLALVAWFGTLPPPSAQ